MINLLPKLKLKPLQTIFNFSPSVNTLSSSDIICSDFLNIPYIYIYIYISDSDSLS
jgi:hypothetical protein